jgi:hypothetical protein
MTIPASILAVCFDEAISAYASRSLDDSWRTVKLKTSRHQEIREMAFAW